MNKVSECAVLEIRETGKCNREVDVTFAAADVAKASLASIREIAGYINLPGFRRGKAPEAVLRKKFGKEIEDDLKKRLVGAAVEKLMEDKTLEVVNCGVAEDPVLADKADFKFTLKVDLAPKFDVGDYRSIRVDVPEKKLDDAALEERIKFYRNAYAKYEDTEGPAAAGDMLKADYKSDFVLPENASAGLKRQAEATDGFLWLSDPEMIPGSIRELTGVKTGDSKTFKAEYPADYREKELAGKTVEYTVTVKGIQRRADLTDEELCSRVGVKTIEEFKAQLEKIMQQESASGRRAELADKLFEAIDKSIADFDLPQGVLEAETSAELRKVAESTVKTKEDAESFEKDLESHRNAARETARKNCRKNFILRKIADAEEITLNENEVDQQIQAMSSYYNYKKNEFRAMLEKSGRLDGLCLQMLNGKVLDTLVESLLKNETEKTK
ncbi:MAG: trigger factor [Victivallaceae bacterium]|nr:trigger factor [Victivallaceae bacterium]